MRHGQRRPGRPAGFATSLVLLLALCAALVAPASALADVNYEIGTSAAEASATSVTIPSPAITQDHVDSGAILIAHLAAVGTRSQSSIYLCPPNDSWSRLSRTLDSGNVILQEIWYRTVESTQDPLSYDFTVNADGCGSNSSGSQERNVVGVISLYTGVDTSNPILAIESASTGIGDAPLLPSPRFPAPAIATEQPAGSFELRFFSTNLGTDIARPVQFTNPVDLPQHYQSSMTDLASNLSETIAAFGDTLETATSPGTFMAEASEPTIWAASTVILRATDATAPTTTATATTVSGDYLSDTWASTPVTVTLSAQDNPGGTGVETTYYSINGGLPQTGTQIVVSTPGTTTIDYWSVDNAGTTELPQTFTVRIDDTDPTASATGATSSAAYVPGTFTNDAVTVTLTAEDTVGESGVREVRYTVGAGQEQVVPGATATIPVTTEGTTTISYYAVDNAGNASDPQTFAVLIDQTAPVINGTLQDQTLDATSPSGTVVTWQTPIATDAISGSLQVVCTPPSGSTFVPGQTIVTCTATDQAGNSTSQTFTVTVRSDAALFIELRSMINDLGLTSSTQRTLLTQAQMAESLANANQPQLACMQLASLDLQIRAQESKRRIDRREAAGIYAQTQQIREVIGCGGNPR